MTLFREILAGRYLRRTALVVLVQQAMVALGTYLMARVVIDAAKGLELSSLILLFACLTLPGTLVHFLLARCTFLATKEAQRRYFSLYFATNQGKPSVWRSSGERSRRHDVLCKSGQDAVQSTVHFLVDVAATTLNILLNTASVVLATNALVGVAIAVAGALGFLVIHLADGRISDSARQEIQAESGLNAHVIRSWDNIVLGNSLFLERWKRRFEALFLAARESGLRALWQRDGAIAVAGLLTNLSVVGFSLTYAWIHRADSAILIGLLVTLPRSLQIVMHIQIVQSYWAQWKGLKEKLGVVEAGTHAPEEACLDAFILGEKIEVVGAGLMAGADPRQSALRDLASQSGAKGRITVSGPNGSGKSTLLLSLKAELGNRAVYLPAQHELELEEGDKPLSSGQRALSALRDLAASDAGVVLLDEWDANLSPENRQRQSAALDEIAGSKLLIEIRHGRETA